MGKALVACEVSCDLVHIASRSLRAFADAFLHFLSETVCVSDTVNGPDVLVLNNRRTDPLHSVPVYIFDSPLRQQRYFNYRCRVLRHIRRNLYRHSIAISINRYRNIVFT